MDEKDENIIENQAEEEKKDTTANEAPIEVKAETQNEQTSTSEPAVEGEVLEEDKPNLSIAAMILGIVSLVFWCYWPISYLWYSCPYFWYYSNEETSW